jgi:predicted transcriptional regulator
MDSFLDCLIDATSVMGNTRLKTLNMWAEEQFDINQQINIQEFTEVTCCERQMKVAKAAIKTKTGVSSGREKA